MPDSQFQPSLFRWKTVALVLVALIAVTLIADILMYIYLQNHPEAPTNLTFINDVIGQSALINSEEQIEDLIEGLTLANPNIKYQYSNRIARGTGLEYTYENIVEKILSEGYSDLLFLYELEQTLNDSPNRTIIGVYAQTTFKVPRPSDEDDATDNFREDLEYYTFEYGDNRQSTLIGIGGKASGYNAIETKFLKANSTKNESLNLLDCKTYRMNKKYSYLTHLELFNLTFSKNSTQPKLVDYEDSDILEGVALINEENEDIASTVKFNSGSTTHLTWQCFYGINSQAELVEKLIGLLGGRISLSG